MKTVVIIIIAVLTTIAAAAQKNGNVREVPLQITLFPPLGTNGIYAGNTVNQFSLNIIAGYAAGLSGVEFGGFANINREFMNGVQFAGFANYTGGEVNGVQFAGFANISNQNAEVVQFAGFANFNNGATTGLQAAGFANFTRGNSSVIQAAGFANFSSQTSGAQLAGFGNFASDSAKGVQIAGFGNFATNVEGVQITGFINAAKTVNGVQIGVLNIADTVKNGIPVGVLSIVRNGYREFEIGFSEGLNSYASFKIGVKQFYNIFSIGIQYFGQPFRWGFGYGIGSKIYDSEELMLNLEAMSYHISEGSYFTSAYNDLQQLKLTFARNLSDKISVFAGPTLNLMISDYYRINHTDSGSGLPPYKFTNHWSGRTNLQGWIGFNAGIRIR